MGRMDRMGRRGVRQAAALWGREGMTAGQTGVRPWPICWTGGAFRGVAGSLSSVVDEAEGAIVASAGYSRRSVLVGLSSAGVLGLAGCSGFFIDSTTTTTLTSSATMATSGGSVVLTAKVVSALATGTVTFYDGTTELGTETLTAGSAAYTTTTLADGTHTLTAVYGGDTTYNGSTSAVVTVVVSASLEATTTALASSTTSTSAGMSVVLTATVSATGASSTAETGSVAFYDGSAELGSGVVSAGVATYTTTTLAAGSHTLQAIYGGDGNYATSTSSSVTVTIT